MYKLSAMDKVPRTLFGKVYYWSADDDGCLHLISHAKLVDTVATLNEALADA